MNRIIDIKDSNLNYSPVINQPGGPVYVNYGDYISVKKSRNLTKNPSKSRLFVQRDDDIENIKNTLESNDIAIIVSGMGGIGKTELAKQYYWRESSLDNYKHFAWINYSDNIKESFLNCFNLDLHFNDKDSIDNKFSKLVDELNKIEGKVLICIDNFTSNEDSYTFKEECEILNSFNNNINILITSREIITPFEQLKLGFLNQEKCRALFYAYYKGEKDDESLNIIIDLVGYHTLTIELLSKTANECGYTIEKLLTIVKDIGFNLNEVISEEVEHNIFTDLLFNHLLKLFSLADLNEDEKYIMVNLSILPSRSIKKDDFKKWIGIDNNNNLNKLIKRGWVNEEQVEGSYYIRCHQLIQEIVRENLSPSITMYEYLINSITQELHTQPGDNRLEKVSYLDIGVSIIKNIKTRTASIGKILNSMALLFSEIGDFKTSLKYGLEACQIFEYEKDDYILDLGAVYCNIANIYNENSDFQSALKYALISKQIFELSYNKEELSLVYDVLSICYINIGDIDKAIEYAEMAKVIKKELCNDKLLATSYNNLATLYLEKGNHQRSLDYLLKSKNMKEQILEKDHPSLAKLYNNLFMAYASIGKLNLALDYILKSNEIIEKIYSVNHPEMVTHYSNLSVIYYQIGNNEKALEYGIKSENIAENIFIEPHEKKALVYTTLTAIYKNKGDLNKALYYSKKDVSICEKIYNDKHILRSISYNNLAMVYYDLKEYKEAMKYALLAKDIRKSNFKGNHEKLATSYNNLMLIYSKLKNYSNALKYGLKSEQMFKEIFGESNLSVVTARMNLAMIYLEKRDLDKAKKYFMASEKSIKLINNNITNYYLRQVYEGLIIIYTLKNDVKNIKKYQKLYNIC